MKKRYESPSFGREDRHENDTLSHARISAPRAYFDEDDGYGWDESEDGDTLGQVRFSASRVSFTDPDGSYTGRPVNRYEIPVQDADDL